MLLRFRFSNFRSFKEEQELSFIAANKKDTSPGAVWVPEIQESVVQVVALYGANASGKTNVLRALQFLKKAVSDSHRLWDPNGGIPAEPFAANSGDGLPCRIVVDLLSAGVRYEYGFAFTRKAILQEWLHAYPTGRRQVWFDRKGQEFSFGRHLGGDNRALQARTRLNSLFLSVAAQENHRGLMQIYDVLTNVSPVIESANSYMLDTIRRLSAQERYRKNVLPHLAIADFGIIDIGYQEIDGDLEPQMIHRIEGQAIPFQHTDESAGTLAFHSMIGAILLHLEEGWTTLIDELDASLHPVLVNYLPRLYTNPESNPNRAQLIFTTHNTSLISSGLLRRDQIWFTEKDREGRSSLYPLTDFKPRRDTDLERGYLQGRYGAIPFVEA